MASKAALEDYIEPQTERNFFAAEPRHLVAIACDLCCASCSRRTSESASELWRTGNLTHRPFPRGVGVCVRHWGISRLSVVPFASRGRRLPGPCFPGCVGCPAQRSGNFSADSMDARVQPRWIGKWQSLSSEAHSAETPVHYRSQLWRSTLSDAGRATLGVRKLRNLRQR